MEGDPVLSQEQVRAMRDGWQRAGKVLLAAKVAGFNGWTLSILAGLTALFGLGSPVLLVLAVGMGVVARNEFRGRDLIRAFDPAGPLLLGRNQLGFMALVVGYCVWSIHRTRASPDPQWAVLETLVGLDPGYIRDLVAVGYVAAIVATVLFVGGNALFYFRRQAILEEYLASTPTWVVRLQKLIAPPTSSR